MNITHDLDGRLQLQQNGLTDKYLARLQADVADLGLGEVDMLAGPLASDLEELLDDLVNVERDLLLG